MQRLLLWFVVVAMVALGSVSCSQFEEDDDVLKVGDKVPTFSVELSDGTRYDSQQRDGRPTLIVFFTTSCVDCQRELPLLDERYRRQDYSGMRVLCISRAEGEETVRAFWEKHGLTLPYSAQPDRRIYDLFARSGIPRIYRIDPNGTISNISFAVEP